MGTPIKKLIQVTGAQPCFVCGGQPTIEKTEIIYGTWKVNIACRTHLCPREHSDGIFDTEYSTEEAAGRSYEAIIARWDRCQINAAAFMKEVGGYPQ